jgi:SAM-dependent methyltransferase
MPRSESAFDGLAAGYDSAFTETQIGRDLRRRVQQRLDTIYAAGDTVLELGCGTGQDALHLAQRGLSVIATDASRAMLHVARAKLPATVQVQHLDLHHLPPPDDRILNGAFANFGVINVLPAHHKLALWLAAQMRPGAIIAFGVMAPACLWELGWHTLHGDLTTATRRWRRFANFTGADAAPIPIYYPGPGHLARQVAPYFERVHLQPLGLWLPPSDAFGVVEQRPTLHRALIRLENACARFGGLARFADHYWIEFQRTDAPIP